MNAYKRSLQIILVIIVCLLLFTNCNIETIESSSNPYKSIDISFTNNKDGIQLSGTLTIPNKTGPLSVVVLIHGSGPHDRDLKFGKHSIFKDIAEQLALKGIAVLRYDKRGCGKSGGNYEPFDIESFTSDGLSAVEYLNHQEHIKVDSIGALGISQGGIIVPKMALSSNEVDLDFIVLMAAPAIWGKEYFMQSSIAIAQASGFGEKDCNKIESIYDEFWPLCTKATLLSKEYLKAVKQLDELSYYMTDSTRDILNMNNADSYLSFIRSSKVIKSMSYDPYSILTQVKCPILALYGNKDVQTSPNGNFDAIKKIAKNSKSKYFKYVKIYNVNHMFQPCSSGLPEEYLTINDGMSPIAIDLITEFILDIEQ